MLYQDNSEVFSAHNFFNDGQGIVSLCGSTKFFIECMELNKRLTFQGWVVLMCGSWGHSYHKYVESTNTDYSKVKKLHFIKILQSQAIVVVSDKSGYIGSSTKAEIEFAKHQNIPIFYFDGEDLTGETEVKSPSNFLMENSIIDNFAKTNSLGF
jgi:hypothetical protein